MGPAAASSTPSNLLAYSAIRSRVCGVMNFPSSAVRAVIESASSLPALPSSTTCQYASHKPSGEGSGGRSKVWIGAASTGVPVHPAASASYVSAIRSCSRKATCASVAAMASRSVLSDMFPDPAQRDAAAFRASGCKGASSASRNSDFISSLSIPCPSFALVLGVDADLSLCPHTLNAKGHDVASAQKALRRHR